MPLGQCKPGNFETGDSPLLGKKSLNVGEFSKGMNGNCPVFQNAGCPSSLARRALVVAVAKWPIFSGPQHADPCAAPRQPAKHRRPECSHDDAQDWHHADARPRMLQPLRTSVRPPRTPVRYARCCTHTEHRTGCHRPATPSFFRTESRRESDGMTVIAGRCCPVPASASSATGAEVGQRASRPFW